MIYKNHKFIYKPHNILYLFQCKECYFLIIANNRDLRMATNLIPEMFLTCEEVKIKNIIK